jgi:hypothetical protein
MPSYQPLHQLPTQEDALLNHDQLNPMVNSLIDPEWMPSYQPLHQFPAQEDALLNQAEHDGLSQAEEDGLNQIVNSLSDPEWMPKP